MRRSDPGNAGPRRSPAGRIAALLVVLTAPLPLSAQQSQLEQEILDSRRRLEQIRAERDRLQREMSDLRSQVRDVSAELRNIEQQLSASRSVLAEVEFQVEATTTRIQETTRELIETRERLREAEAVLYRRIRNIYKRGALHSVRVLLGADSFTDLLNRYRYLRMLAAHDRSLVGHVTELEEALVYQNRVLQDDLAGLGRLRQQKLEEVAELRRVEQRHQLALGEFRTQERSTLGRLEALEADESRLTSLVSDLERRRVEAERRRAEAGTRALEATSLGTEDAGRIDWPVEGEVIYRYGRERRPDGTVLRWNGLGIGAPTGTPVRAVRPGRVVLAGPFEGYGPTVILSHGDGFYTLYLYLEEIGVVEGRNVAAGQVVGTVGGGDTPEGPHIEFQIRAPPEPGGSPQAQDPLRWLRAGNR